MADSCGGFHAVERAWLIRLLIYRPPLPPPPPAAAIYLGCQTSHVDMGWYVYAGGNHNSPHQLSAISALTQTF